MRLLLVALSLEWFGCQEAHREACRNEAIVMTADRGMSCDVGARMTIEVVGTQTIARCTCVEGVSGRR